MQRKASMYLFEMRETARAIQQFVHARSVGDLSNDQMLRSALCYEFMIIGNMLSRLRDIDATTAHQIADGDKIMELRNQVVNRDAVIHDGILWKVIKECLPVLEKELTLLLGEA